MLDWLKEVLARPVAFGYVLLAYVGVLIVLFLVVSSGSAHRSDIRHEADQRQSDVCSVIINVHNNARFRANTERDALEATKSFLRTGASRENPALRDAIIRGIPAARARIRVAQANVRATRVPPSCMDFQNETNNEGTDSR